MDERLLNDPEFLQEAVGVLKREIDTLQLQRKELDQGLQELKELAKKHAGNHEIGQLMSQVYRIADRALKVGVLEAKT